MVLEHTPYSNDKEKLYDLLMENTDESFILMDKDFRILFVNKAAAQRIQEISQKTVLPGSSALYISTPENVSRLKETYRKALNGETTHYNTTYTLANGKKKTFAVLIKPAVSTEGSFKGVVITSRDISEEEERAEEWQLSLKISRLFARNASLQSALSDLLELLSEEYQRDAAEIWVTDMDHTALRLKARFNCKQENDNTISITRFEKGEGLPGLCWKNKSAVYVGDVQHDERFKRKQFVAENNIKTAEAIPLLLGEEVVAVLIFFQLQKEKQATLLNVSPGIIALTSNEIKRKDSEERLQRFFELSPDVLSIAGTDGYFKKVNASFPAILGYTTEEILSTSYFELIHPDDLESSQILVKELANGLQENYFENRFRAKNGKYHWFAWTTTSLKEEGLIFVVGKDITEKKKSEQLHVEMNEALEKRALQLASSNAELERFAYVASHDLQEPLRMVSSFLQLLQKKYNRGLDETAHQYIHFAVDGAERMKKLILDLLDYSRVGTNQEAHTFVDMNQVFLEVKEYFSQPINGLNATIQTEQLPVVKANLFQMKQVVQNLLGNAIKYRSEALLHIQFTAREHPGEWVFCMTDNGIGIDPRFSEKIFIIFQRLHNSSEYEGTGIGLAIARKIIEKHGGRIWVEENTPQGSKFYFSIKK